jgi:hypothetical protein
MYKNLISEGIKSRYKWLGLVEGGESTGDQLTRVQQEIVNCKRASSYRKATKHRFPIAPPRITNHRAYHGTPQISITQPPRLPHPSRSLFPTLMPDSRTPQRFRYCTSCYSAFTVPTITSSGDIFRLWKITTTPVELVPWNSHISTPAFPITNWNELRYGGLWVTAN